MGDVSRFSCEHFNYVKSCVKTFSSFLFRLVFKGATTVYQVASPESRFSMNGLNQIQMLNFNIIQFHCLNLGKNIVFIKKFPQKIKHGKRKVFTHNLIETNEAMV